MTDRLPIFPLRTVLFPGNLLRLHVFEPRYRLMVSRFADKAPCFGVVLIRSGNEAGDEPETCDVGTSVAIEEHVKLPDGRSYLLVKGERRFRAMASNWDESYLMATIDWCDPPLPGSAVAGSRDALHRIQKLLEVYLGAYYQATGQRARFRDFGDEPVAVAYAAAAALPLSLEVRQRLLEADPANGLLELLEETVRRETALLVRTGSSVALPGPTGARFTCN